ncbi:MAG: riboflavin biosynthesis protein RibF [Planctomycetota bacterium]|nr:MAG: riboflavin biosynthesis protein RibF [Planctomycetota bacterium]
MKLFDGIQTTPPLPRPVLTMGVFDGVHRGHQELLQQLKNWAKEVQGTSVVLTFFPHPKVVLEKTKDFPYICSLPHRLLLLEKEGVDVVILEPFTPQFAAMEAMDFLQYLTQKLNCRHLLLGPDGRFGHQAKGNLQLLERIAPALSLHIRTVRPVRWQQAPKISSTYIREMIQAGKFSQIQENLGRPFSLFGKVVPGDGLGKQIGFPTANIDTEGALLPPFGVYALNVNIYQRNPVPSASSACFQPLAAYRGIANIGVRPTTQRSSKPQVEVHIPQFHGDLYGKYLELFFLGKIREEKKFASLEELSHQIQKDCQLLANFS